MKLRNMTSVYFVGEQGILCLYRIGSRVAGNKFIGSAGGHFEPEELNDPKKCVLREMQEELGLSETDVEGLTLRYITHRFTGGEIRQNYYFFAELLTEKPLTSNEGNLRWCTETEALSLPMPVSARAVLCHYFRDGRQTDTIYGCISDGQQAHIIPMNA